MTDIGKKLLDGNSCNAKLQNSLYSRVSNYLWSTCKSPGGRGGAVPCTPPLEGAGGTAANGDRGGTGPGLSGSSDSRNYSSPSQSTWKKKNLISPKFSGSTRLTLRKGPVSKTFPTGKATHRSRSRWPRGTGTSLQPHPPAPR